MRSRGWSSLDQSNGQAERPAQMLFFACHLAMIVFVIVAGKVQDAVQNQDFNFLCRVMPEMPCVGRCDLRRDRHISR